MNHNGRPKKYIKRIEKVTVRFSAVELEAIELKAKNLKIARTELIRNLVVKHIDDFNYMH